MKPSPEAIIEVAEVALASDRFIGALRELGNSGPAAVASDSVGGHATVLVASRRGDDEECELAPVFFVRGRDGRWQSVYGGNGIIIATRMRLTRSGGNQLSKCGIVRPSAPLVQWNAVYGIVASDIAAVDAASHVASRTARPKPDGLVLTLVESGRGERLTVRGTTADGTAVYL